MRAKSLFIFLALLVLLPSIAYADGLLNLNISLGGCAGGSTTTNCSTDPSAGFFSSIACKVMKTFSAGIMPIYCNILLNPDYIAAISALMVLYVTLTGVMYVSGITQARAGDAVLRLLKMTFVYTMATNADIYMSVVFNTVMSAPQSLIEIILTQSTSSGSGSQTFFEYVDKGIAQIFSNIVPTSPQDAANENYSGVDMKIMVLGLAIWKAFPGGEFIAFVFFTVICGWLMTYLEVMVRILIAMMGLMFLLVLGPIFIPTLLFGRSSGSGGGTSYIGNEWIQMIISFMMQMVLVVMFLIMVESFFIELSDMLQAGYQKISMEKGFGEYIQQFSGDVDSVQKQSNYTSEGAQQYLSTLNGDMQTWLPKFFFDLVVMMVVIFATYNFLKIVPNLATSISSSNPNFPSVMGGTGWGGRSTPVNLPGQKEVKGNLSNIVSTSEANDR